VAIEDTILSGAVIAGRSGLRGAGAADVAQFALDGGHCETAIARLAAMLEEHGVAATMPDHRWT
jgi:hypothetical protein